MPIVASVTKSRRHRHRRRRRPALVVHEAARAGHDPAPRPGVPRLPARRASGRPRASCPTASSLTGSRRRPRRPSTAVGALLAGAERPAFIVGSDVYWAGAWDALRGRGRARCACRASSTASAAAACRPTTSWPSCGPAACSSSEADLVVVVGTPLDFRLGFGRFGDGPGRPPRRLAEPAGRRTSRCTTAAGDLAADPDARWPTAAATGSTTSRWIAELRDAETAAARAATGPCCDVRRRPDPPGPHLRRAGPAPGARRGGHLRRRRLRLATPASSSRSTSPAAGSTPARTAASATGPATRSRPGSRGRRARSSLLLGDGAAGFSLMDVDTLVRHDLPVVMVVGNNGIWGLEKHPMQVIYGYDVACDLQPGCRYDEVVRALGGAGETVDRAGGDRARARPGLRGRRALPGQRAHRPGRRLPPLVQPGLSAAPPTTVVAARPSWLGLQLARQLVEHLPALDPRRQQAVQQLLQLVPLGQQLPVRLEGAPHALGRQRRHRHRPEQPLDLVCPHLRHRPECTNRCSPSSTTEGGLRLPMRQSAAADGGGPTPRPRRRSDRSGR